MAVTQNITVTMTNGEFLTINGAAAGTVPQTSPLNGIPGLNISTSGGNTTVTLNPGERRSGNVERISRIFRRAEYMYPTVSKNY